MSEAVGRLRAEAVLALGQSRDGREGRLRGAGVERELRADGLSVQSGAELVGGKIVVRKLTGLTVALRAVGKGERRAGIIS